MKKDDLIRYMGNTVSGCADSRHGKEQYMNNISKESRSEEYVYLPSKHGIIQVPRYSEPLPTKEGCIQFVFTVRDQIAPESYQR